MRTMRDTEPYRTRRYAAAAVLIAVVATLFDLIAEKGSGWPVFQTFAFFFLLASGPAVVTRVLDIFLESEDDA